MVADHLSFIEVPHSLVRPSDSPGIGCLKSTSLATKVAGTGHSSSMLPPEWPAPTRVTRSCSPQTLRANRARLSILLLVPLVDLKARAVDEHGSSLTKNGTNSGCLDVCQHRGCMS